MNNRKKRKQQEQCAFRRKHATAQEEKLWSGLRNRGLLGLRFERQRAKAGTIVDFYCAELQLAINIRPDGLKWGFQDEATALAADGIKALSFSNYDVTERHDWVTRVIAGACKARQRERAAA